MSHSLTIPESRNGTPVLAGKQLVVVRGAKPDTGRVFPLPRQGVFTVGRSQASNTRLLDPKISRNHCEIEVREGQVLVRQVPPAPGADRGPVVLVNDTPVAEKQLASGDVVRIGDTELRYDDVDPYEAATVAGKTLAALIHPSAPGAAELAQLLGGAMPGKLGDAPAKPAPATPSPYEILEEIGRGEAATVFRAHDLALKRNVAIKELKDAIRHDPQQSRPIFEEAEFLAKVEHENLVKVHGLDRERGWIIMELMRTSIAAKLATSALAPDLIRSALKQSLEGLRFLHEQKKLHGAIKPSNLLIDSQGRVKLSDGADLTLEGEVQKPRGNMKYVAPELLSPEFGPIGAGVDLYCLGFAALEMLAGPRFTSLFKGVGEDAIDPELGWLRLHGSRAEPLPRATDIAPDVPADVAHVIDRLLQRDVNQRYASAADALRDLQELPLILFGDGQKSPQLSGHDARPASDDGKSWLNRQMSNLWVSVPTLGVLSFLIFSLLMYDPDKKPKAAGVSGFRTPQFALLVGVEDYGKELPRFRHAEADMLELSRVLLACGYKPDQVRTLTQNLGETNPAKHMPTAANIRQELKVMTEQRKGHEGLLLALAGHVVQFRGESECYFCPSDARLSDRNTLVPLSEIYQALEQWPGEYNLVLIDGCRNVSPGDFDAPAVPIQLDAARPQAVTAPKNTPVYFSCGAGKKSFAHLDARNGVFFHYVIKALQGYAVEDFTRRTTVERLERYVTAEASNYVSKTYGDTQRPELAGPVHPKASVVEFDTRMAMCIEGFRHAARRRYSEAAYYCGVMLNEQEYVEAYITRAVSKMQDGKPSEAVADLSRAIEMAPTNATAFGHRAEARLAMGDRPAALADVSRAIKLDPLFGPFYGIRARIEAANDKDAALGDLGRALALNPNRPVTHKTRGTAYLEMGELDKAREEFAAASRLTPGDPEVWLQRGLVLEAQENYLQAAEEFSRAVGVDSEYVPAYLHRAKAYDCLAVETVDPDAKKGYEEKASRDREKMRSIDGKPAPVVE